MSKIQSPIQTWRRNPSDSRTRIVHLSNGQVSAAKFNPKMKQWINVERASGLDVILWYELPDPLIEAVSTYTAILCEDISAPNDVRAFILDEFPETDEYCGKKIVAVQPVVFRELIASEDE